jgi:HSP20 family protein
MSLVHTEGRGCGRLTSRLEEAAMTLTRRPLERNQVPIRNALERWFGEWPNVPLEGLTELAPPIDVRETADAYIVEIDLPGQDPGNIEVLIEGRTLTVRGKFSEESERREGEYLLRERRRGQFMRAVALPGMVDVDRVTSRAENGELIVTLPKASQNRARRIEITGNGRKKSEATQVNRVTAGSRQSGSSGSAGSSGASGSSASSSGGASSGGTSSSAPREQASQRGKARS